MSFGERLQALRHENGLTQEEFAGQLNVSRQAVSKWESSRGYPEIEKIVYICNRYGVSMSELFRDEVPLRGRPDRTEEQKPPPLQSTPLRQALGNFVANLSPGNRLFLLGGAALVCIALLVLFCIFILKGESNQMQLKIVWTLLLVLFSAGEAVTVGLTSIWFAAGALGALIVALLDGPLWLQIGLFIAISALCLLAARPLAQRYLNNRVVHTNADRIIGMQARVTEDIDNLRGVGAVSADGKIWTARSQSGEAIPAGAVVQILRIEGVKVFVETSKEEVKC